MQLEATAARGAMPANSKIRSAAGFQPDCAWEGFPENVSAYRAQAHGSSAQLTTAFVGFTGKVPKQQNLAVTDRDLARG